MQYTYYVAVIWLISACILLGKILFPIFMRLIKTLTSKTETTLDDRIFKETKGPIESCFFLFLFYLGVHLIPFYESAIPVVEQYTTSAVIIVFAYLSFKAVKALFHWYYEEGHKSSQVKVELSLLPLLQKLTQIFIVLVALILVLSELGYSVAGLLALTSLMAVVLGLASQETLANMFAGIALQLDRVYHYGDYLRLPTGEALKLRKIGLRSSKLYDVTGKVVIVSNSEFAKMRVTKLGSDHSFTLNIPFEAPINIKTDALLSEIRSYAGKEHIKGLEDIGHIKILVQKVKMHGWYEGVVQLPLKESTDCSPTIDRINRIIIESIEKEGNTKYF
jgi:small-conductance mechanosensitive channel